jgi:L-rhamnose mutarotase
MRRICFVLHVKPGRIEEYKTRHAAVWPEMRQALQDAGWRNYSLFLRPDGTLIGYLECEDFDACRAAMAEKEVNARWQAEMGDLFAETDVAPDEAMQPIEEVFHLD